MDEYIPFDREWEKEMMRFTKKELIGLLRKQFVQDTSHADDEKVVLVGTTKCPECGFREKHLARCSHHR